MAAMSAADRLSAAFADPSIVELIINEDGAVYIERANAGSKRRLRRSLRKSRRCSSLVAPFFGAHRLRRFDCPGRLTHHPGGSSRDGLAVTIRKRPKQRPTLEHLAGGPTLQPPAPAS